MKKLIISVTNLSTDFMHLIWYQVFGSQSEGFGFKLADEKTKKEIKNVYGIQ